MKNAPTIEEFTEYATEKIALIGDDPKFYSEWILIKFLTWESDDWHKNPKGKRIPIKNWKTTLLSCLPYREGNKTKSINVNDPKVISITERIFQKYGGDS